MRVSYRCLKEMVDFPFCPEELAEKLTSVGLEVRTLEPFGRLDKVVVGKVLSIKDHPNADRLKVVEVDIGKSTLSLVCGAPNVREGLLVPVALEGARLANGMRVKKAKIRGVDSPGMLCSEKELGLGDDHSGIMAFPFSLPLGKVLTEALELDDVVLDIEITSNRGDCLSLMGIAREIAALTGNKLHPPSWAIEEREGAAEKAFQVKIEEPDLCPYYSARLIRDVKVGPSPLWLWRKILLSGNRPINNVVDVTNYVMWEMGQPLHPFDYSCLANHTIIVRRARQGETLTTLDGIKRNLEADMLVIADARRPIALAGIMGGEETQVQDSTKDILLEAAYFNPVSIRRTSRRMGLSTQASYRFERGVDPLGVKKALDRASSLIQKVAGGKVEGKATEKGKLPKAKRYVFLRPSRINQVLGEKITPSRVKNVLESLQFKLEEEKEGWKVNIPSFRRDVSREIDLIEEVARFYGYNRFKISLPPLGGEAEEDLEELARERVEDILRGLGFYEVVGMELTDEDSFLKAKLSLEEAIAIKNPLSAQQKILSTHLFPHLLEIASYNLNQEEEKLRIFELADVFRRTKTEGESIRNERASAYFEQERPHLGGLVLEREFDFLSLKGIIEALLEGLGIEEAEFIPSSFGYLSKKQSALAKKKGICLGAFGKLNSEICQNFKLPSSLYVFEFDFSALLSFFVPKKSFKPLPKFPSVRRDLALIVKEDIPAEAIRKAILKGGGRILEKVELFDLYRGKSIPDGHKSLAYSLTFRAQDRTLKDEEVDRVQQALVSMLERKFGARLRGKE